MHVRLFCVLSVMWLTLWSVYKCVCMCGVRCLPEFAIPVRVASLCVLGGYNSLSLPVS